MKKEEFYRKAEYLKKEQSLFDIPLRKEYLLKNAGSGKKILDIGCCGGQIGALLIERGNEVFGVETNEVSAARATERGLKVTVKDLEEGIPFEDSSFDFVYAGEIIEHLFDTKFVLAECARVLREGGEILITTPNLNSIYNRLTVLLGFHLHYLGCYPEDVHGDHIRIFNLGKLSALLKMVGLRLIESRGVSYIPLCATALYPFATLGDLLMVRALKA